MDDINLAIGERLKGLRRAKGQTLDQLAERSGVSRAMISRIERGEASPTAVLLSRLCVALGQSLSVFFAAEEAGPPLMRHADQPVWRDPQTGYLRRSVSPPGLGVDVVEVTFPPQAKVSYGAQPANQRQWQHVWLLEGEMELTVGDTVWTLQPGDCLFMPVADVLSFANKTDQPARYAVIIDIRKDDMP